MARGIAADAIQIGALPLLPGRFVPADALLDAAQPSFLDPLLGWHWASCPRWRPN